MSEEIGAVRRGYTALKLGLAAAVATWVGIDQVLVGTRQTIVAGCGALFVALVLWAFIALIVFAGGKSADAAETPAGTPPTVDTANAAESTETPVLFCLLLGLGLMMVPALLYLYLSFAMEKSEPGLAFVLGFLFVPGGLFFIFLGLRGLWRGE
jgi:hypothetical protein